MKTPITTLKQLQDDLKAFPLTAMQCLLDFAKHDLDKLVESLEQQERDHAEQIDDLKEEISALGDELKLQNNYINRLDGAYL